MTMSAAPTAVISGIGCDVGANTGYDRISSSSYDGWITVDNKDSGWQRGVIVYVPAISSSFNSQ